MTAVALVAGLQLAAGVVSGLGAVQQLNAQAAASEYNARVADRNARTVLQQTESEAESQRREGRRKLSAIRAQYGASGLTMEGSPLDVLEDSAMEVELDVQKTRYKGHMEALGYTEKAKLSRLQAESAKDARALSFTSQLLGGAERAGMTLVG